SKRDWSSDVCSSDLSMKVTDLAHAVVPGAELVDVGLRPGEKLHEEMISPEEGRRAVMIRDGKYFIIQPDLASWGYEPPAAAVSRSEERRVGKGGYSQ